jgi:hypothetical protein
MIRLSPPDFSYVQVDRPIIDIEGAKRFLALAQSIGDSILGEEIVGPTISRLGFDLLNIDDDENVLFREPVYEDTPVGTPFFETTASNDLSMVLMHKGVKRELAKRYGIVQSAINLSRPRDSHYLDVERADGRRERAKKPLPNLMGQLANISIAHGMNPKKMPIVCDRVDVIEVPGDNYILGLSAVPGENESKVLHDQAKAVNDRLAIKNKQLARVASPCQVVIPFARFHRDVPSDEYQSLLKSLNDPDVMGTVRFVLGEARVTPH